MICKTIYIFSYENRVQKYRIPIFFFKLGDNFKNMSAHYTCQTKKKSLNREEVQYDTLPMHAT